MPRRRRCSRCARNRDERFFVSARGRVCSDCQGKRVAVASRSVRLAENYGITLAEYVALLEAQGGRCAICGGTRRGNLDVDHDHARERELLAEGVEPALAARRSVRGLLCRRCNRQLLRHARDSAALLRAAADYLDGPPAYL